MASYTPQSSMEDAQRLLDAAEDNFKHQKPQEALRLAIMAKQRNPRFDALDKFIAAYGVHALATQKRSNGDIDLYAVLGISDAKADAKTIKRSFNKLALMVHPDKNGSAAAEGAFKLISEAWEVLSEPSKRKDYDLRWGPRPSNGSQSSSPSEGAASPSATYGGRACPKCNQWCNYENKNCSSINCSNCCRKFVFRSSSSGGFSVPPSCSSSGTAAASSGASAYSHNSGGDETVCPFCGGNFVEECGDRVSITCVKCKFGFAASSKHVCRVGIRKLGHGHGGFSFKIRSS